MAIDPYEYIERFYGISKPERFKVTFIGFPPHDSRYPDRPVERVGDRLFVAGRMFLIEYPPEQSKIIS